MDTAESGGGARPGLPEPLAADPAKARLDKRAEALRANLKRRKAQSRGRAEPHFDRPAPDSRD